MADENPDLHNADLSKMLGESAFWLEKIKFLSILRKRTFTNVLLQLVEILSLHTCKYDLDVVLFMY